MTESVEVLVVGGGQAGIAMSEHLSALKIPHIVLERSRIAENWSSMRWDSLVANGPAWHDRFPNLEFEDVHPDAFPGKDRVARYFNDYAAMIEARLDATFRRAEAHVIEITRDIPLEALDAKAVTRFAANIALVYVEELRAHGVVVRMVRRDAEAGAKQAARTA